MENTTSEWIELRDSKIHARGVYAAKDIPKGTRVIEYVGEKISKAESDRRATEVLEKAKTDKNHGAVYIFEIDEKHDIDGHVEYNTARLINHSCSPNCMTINDSGRIWIKAKKDIRKGTELTYDYGYGIDSWQDHPCRCGAPNCIGYIVDSKHRPKLRRLLKRKGLL